MLILFPTGINSTSSIHVLPSVLTANNDYSIPSAFTVRGHLIVRLYIEALYLKALKKPLICENRTFGLQNDVIDAVSPENLGD